MSLKREQYNEIKRVIDERHYAALRLRDKRREEVYNRFPAFSVYDEEAAKLRSQIVSAKLEKDKERAAKINEELRSIALKKKNLLSEAGYPENYLEIESYCKKCGDTGYVGNEKCSCFKLLETKLLNAEAGLPVDVESETFEKLDLSRYDNQRPIQELLKKTKITQREYMRTSVLPEIKRFIDNFEEPGSHNIFMMGPSGTGKTFLSSCIANALMQRQHSVLYVRAGELFSRLEKEHFSKYSVDADDSLSDKLNDCELLILDDLGAEFRTEYTASELYNIISDRLSHGLSTIISTNLALNQMQSRYDERVVSRFIGQYIVLPFYGKDIRL